MEGRTRFSKRKLSSANEAATSGQPKVLKNQQFNIDTGEADPPSQRSRSSLDASKQKTAAKFRSQSPHGGGKFQLQQATNNNAKPIRTYSGQSKSKATTPKQVMGEKVADDNSASIDMDQVHINVRDSED